MKSSSTFVSMFVALLFVMMILPSTYGFGVVAPVQRQTNVMSSSTSLYMFKGLADAFKNDDSLGKAQNAGLKNGPNYNEQVTVNGKKVPGAVVGQKLTVVAGRVRVKIPVNCQNGDCGTCEVKMNGRKVRACQAVLPSGKVVIET